MSLVCPFHNEGQGVEAFFDAVIPILESLPVHFEIVCVDDGSRDDTNSKLLARAAVDSRVRVVSLSRNFGKEAALSAAIDHAQGDAVIILDADLQDPPELIPSLVAQWQQGFDVVLGRRVDRTSDSWFKRWSAFTFYRLHNAMADQAIPPDVGDFRLMSRKVVAAVQRLPERRRFMKGILAWVGFRSTTLDYTRATRAFGSSKFSGWRLWNLALEGITSFSTVPLRIWTYVGVFVAGASFLYAGFIIYYTLVRGADVPGYASLLTAVLFLGGLQLIGMGILGEYIGRILEETKQRPLYVVESVFPVPDGRTNL